MRKFVYFFICVVIILFAAAFFGWNYLPYWISSTLSQKMGVSVSVNHLHITPNTATIHNLDIGNPTGFTLDKALQIKKIQTNAPASSFFYDHIVVDEVLLSNLYLGLEFESVTDTRGNWTIIMNNLRSSLRDPDQSSKEGKTFLIKKLTIRNIKIDLVFKKNDGKVIHLKPIPYMEFKNVSSEGPRSIGQLINVVMTGLLKEVFLEQHLKDMLHDVIKSPGKGVYNSIKSLFSLDD